MALVSGRCPRCGRDFEVDDAVEAAICPGCGQAIAVANAVRFARMDGHPGICPLCGKEIQIDISKIGDADACPECHRPYVVSRAVEAWRTRHRFDPCEAPGAARNLRESGGSGIGQKEFTIEKGTLMKYEGKRPVVPIPNSVHTIKDYAFDRNTTMRQVKIPSSVKRIYTGAFRGCTNLESVVLPEGLTTINASVFRNCDSLVNVTIPDSVTAIRERAFQDCTKIRRLKLPSRLEIIENNAFQGCTSLIEVNIPDSVTRLGSSAFQGCVELREAHIPAGISMVNWGTFSDCKKLETIEIPPNIKSIERRAFDDCDSVEELVIPSTVKFVHRDAFGKCDILRSVTIGEPNRTDPLLKALDESGTPLPFWKQFKQTVKNWGAGIWQSLMDDHGNSDEDLPEIEQDAFSNCKALKEFNAPRWWKIQHWDCADCLNSYRPLGKYMGCYVATCVYGSYDCPEVWLLRRFRDRVLSGYFWGRAFIRLYYAVSPHLVRLFGNARWFRALCRVPLDRLTAKLRRNGFSDAPYEDPR